ncbi:MAG TPA: phytanoyl-CoA dioxygenase family protein [Acidimicrobiales bacterium]|nr:phytanoyl-CoA dioxygenase family protein [Acidimicrobiales bacterium]
MESIPRLGPDATVDDIVSGMDAVGCTVVEGFLSASKVAALRSELAPHRARTPSGRNDFEGHSTRRIYALFAKVRGFDEIATDPRVLGVLDAVLGSSYQLSAPVGIDIGPGEAPQMLHRDDLIYPLTWPHPEVVVNTMWALDDFTVDNGATMVIPGSHARPPAEPPDPALAIPATMPAGSVLFYHGSLWHHGGANRTEGRRLGVILEYVVSWLRAQENHVLAVPPEVVRTLPERLRELLGYNIHPPFIGYVDGIHPLRVLET